MRILITGGAGFIGSQLAKSLLEKRHEIVVIDNLNDYYDPAIKRANIEMLSTYELFTFVEGDIRSIADLEDIFSKDKITQVVHLAAQAGVRPSIQDPKLYYDVNIIGTLNILETMRKYGCKKMIFGSSSSVYGNNTETPFSESHAVDHPISPYAATKKSGELLCYNYHHLYNFDIFCLRFFSVYGPGQRPEMAIAKFTDAILNGKDIPMYGDGSSERDYTYVEDIVDGIILSMKNLRGYNVFNLGESTTISLKNLIALIEKSCGKESHITQLPMQAGDVSITYADISKAKALLGYQPKTTIEQGVANYVKWYKTQATKKTTTKEIKDATLKRDKQS